jgi:DNA-binding transcriptional ArsR family regulator
MLDEVTIWVALADPKRRQIINLLEEKPRTTSDLSKYFDVSRYAVMKHLKVLEQARLIKSIRQGRTRWNYLNEDLANFMRTRLVDDGGSYSLIEILGLFPGQKPASQKVIPTIEPTKIEQRLLLQAPPAQVFEAFTKGIDSWWSRRAFSDSQMVLEPMVNGRFYEAFGPEGNGILYAHVTCIKQDEELHLQGTFELSERLANSSIGYNHICVTFESQQADTLLCLTHQHVGRVNPNTAETIRSFWRKLLDQHFQPFVERGLPYQHNP